MQMLKTACNGLVFLAFCVLAGCATKPPPVSLRFHEQSPTGLPNTYVREVEVPPTGQKLNISTFPTLSEHDVMEARLDPSAGDNAVMLHFDLHGAHVLNEWTTRARGQYLVVLLEEKPIASLLIEHIITNGLFLLQGDISDEEAKKLVDDLNLLAGRHRDFGDTRRAP